MINLFAGVGETLSIPSTQAAEEVELIRNASPAKEQYEVKPYSYNVNFIVFTPNSTGTYYVVCNSSIIAQITVLADRFSDTLSAIQGAVLGSWHWDKSDNSLVLYDVQGTELGSYELLDTANEASRERK